MIEKTTNQLSYVTHSVKNVPPQLDSLWYPSARPLQHYRKTGTNTSVQTDQSFQTPKNCLCKNNRRVGMPFKMIGKKDNGQLKTSCCQTAGTIINFNGNSNIKTASTIVSPTYYSNYYTYLKSRGNTYVAKSSMHKIPGINYNSTPSGDKLDSSHFYENNITENEKCKITIYKPSNESFSTQGGVDSSAVISRMKYLTIIKNNTSFIKPYGIRVPYNENQLFFAKNKVFNCTNCYKVDSVKL
jgi:hypothetical protein